MFLVTPPADQGSKRPLLNGKEKSNEINSAVEILVTYKLMLPRYSISR